MAIEAFGTALRAIPSTIAENAGLDSAELVTQLRAEHAKEGSKAGVDVIRGSVGVKRVRFLFGGSCSWMCHMCMLDGDLQGSIAVPTQPGY